MLKRSLTLLETLIALALVVALAALVIPALVETLDEQAFESAADVTNEQLMLARAHAQSTGTPVEVTYNVEKSQILARFFVPGLPVGENEGAGPESAEATHASKPQSRRHQSDDLSSTKSRKSSGEGEITEGWATQLLSSGIRFLTSPPEDEPTLAAAASKPSADDDIETIADLAGGQEIRLAVFMPDGSALLAEPVWMNDQGGRLGRFSINPWTGIPVFERLANFGSFESTSKAESESDGNSETDVESTSKNDSERSTTNSRGRTSQP